MLDDTVNRVIVLGVVERDPEFRELPWGGQGCNLTVKSTDRWLHPVSGETQETTHFSRVSVTVKPFVEAIKSDVHQGDLIYVEGKMETRNYRDQAGAEQEFTEISVRPFHGSLAKIDSDSSSDEAASAGLGSTRVIFVGTVERNPEIRDFPSGGQFCSFTVKTVDKWINSTTGEKQERAYVNKVGVYSKPLIEKLKGEVYQGDVVFVDGRLERQRFLDAEHADQYFTEVAVRHNHGTFAKLGLGSSGVKSDDSDFASRESSRNGASAETTASDKSRSKGQKSRPSGGTDMPIDDKMTEHGPSDDGDDDIPF